MRSGAVSFCPGFSAREQRVLIGQPLGSHQTLERRQPMFVVARAVVRFSTLRSSLQFFSEAGSPFLPGEMPLLGQLDRECEGLRLPRLGEHGPAVVTRQTRKVRQLRGAGERLKLAQGSR